MKTQKMNQVSTKEAGLRRELVRVYAAIDEKAWDEERWHCWSCGKSRSLSHSHACSRGQNKDLMLDPENIFLQCNKCHSAWENREWEKIVKFANLREMLAYVMEHDEYQYWQLIDGINNYLDSKKNKSKYKM